MLSSSLGVCVYLITLQPTELERCHKENIHEYCELKQKTAELQERVKDTKELVNTDTQKIAQQRSALLQDVALKDPAKALEQILDKKRLADLPDLLQNTLEKPTLLRGKVIRMAAVYEDNREYEQFYLQTGKKKPMRLAVVNPQDLPNTRQEIALTGYTIGEIGLVDASTPTQAYSSESDSTSTPTTSPVLNPDTTGVQRTLVIPVNFTDTTQPSLTTSEISNIVFSEANNVYKESSYNLAMLDGEVRPWITIPVEKTCETGLVADKAMQLVDPDVNFNTYSRIVIFAPFNTSCGWSGLGSIGKYYIPTGEGYSQLSVAWIDAGTSSRFLTEVVTHEIGHNFGLGHSNILECNDKIIKTPINQCASYEYNGYASPMGNGEPVGFNGSDRANLGWLQEREQTVTTSGRYTVTPLNQNTSSTKVLKILRANNSTSQPASMFLEYRDDTGVDAKLLNGIKNQPLLHLGPNTGVYGKSYLVDLVTGTQTQSYVAMQNGATITDPQNGASVTLVSKSSAGATFDIDIGKTDFSTPTVNIDIKSSSSFVSGNLDVAATATDESGIKNISFYIDDNETPMFVDTTAPYEYTIDTTQYTEGHHTITAVAQDSAGDPYGVPNNTGKSYDDVVFQNNKIPPTVSITTPAENQTISELATITVNASDDLGLENVFYYIDDQYIGSSDQAPYSYTFQTRHYMNGPHTIRAIARDYSYNETTSELVNIVIDNADDSAPTATITSPNVDQVVSGTVPFSVSAYDNDTVTKVEFYADDNLIDSDTISPYKLNFNSRALVNGPHILKAKVYDNTGNTGESAPVPVTTNNDFVAPQATITSPTANAVVPGVYTINVTATDNKEVKQVLLQVNGKAIQVKSVAPYTFSVDSNAVYCRPFTYTCYGYLGLGKHEIEIIVTDIDGNSTTVSRTVTAYEDTYPPKNVRITSPKSSYTPLNGYTHTFKATADDDSPIASMSFFQGGTLLYTDTNPPFEFTYTAPAEKSTKFYALRVEAKDTKGNIGYSTTYPYYISPPFTPTITTNQTIKSGGYISSTHKWQSLGYNASMYSSGNFVVKSKFSGNPYVSWSSRTSDHPGAYLLLGESGNLVVRSKAGSTLWESGTAGKGATKLTVTNSGTLLLRTNSGKTVWSSQSGKAFGVNSNRLTNDETLQKDNVLRSQNKKYYLKQYFDGTVALRESSSKKIKWRIAKYGSNNYLKMTDSGNLVMRDKNNNTIWQSGTKSKSGAYLAIRDNGNLVIRSNAGKLLWTYRHGKY